jgi:hypothetical protein
VCEWRGERGRDEGKDTTRRRDMERGGGEGNEAEGKGMARPRTDGLVGGVGAFSETRVLVCLELL